MHIIYSYTIHASSHVDISCTQTRYIGQKDLYKRVLDANNILAEKRNCGL